MMLFQIFLSNLYFSISGQQSLAAFTLSLVLCSVQCSKYINYV